MVPPVGWLAAAAPFAGEATLLRTRVRPEPRARLLDQARRCCCWRCVIAPVAACAASAGCLGPPPSERPMVRAPGWRNLRRAASAAAVTAGGEAPGSVAGVRAAQPQSVPSSLRRTCAAACPEARQRASDCPRQRSALPASAFAQSRVARLPGGRNRFAAPLCGLIASGAPLGLDGAGVSGPPACSAGARSRSAAQGTVAARNSMAFLSSRILPGQS